MLAARPALAGSEIGSCLSLSTSLRAFRQANGDGEAAPPSNTMLTSQPPVSSSCLKAGREVSLACDLALPARAIVNDLVTPVVSHFLPFARLDLGPQAAGAQAGAAIEAA
jgi:hypothetical protein